MSHKKHHNDGQRLQQKNICCEQERLRNTQLVFTKDIITAFKESAYLTFVDRPSSDIVTTNLPYDAILN